MRARLKKRAIPVFLLALLTVVSALIAGRTAPAGIPPLEALPATTQEAAEAALLGCPRGRVLSAWGEPDGCLSGFFGDIYMLEGGDYWVIMYYDTEQLNQDDGIYAVPVQHIVKGRPTL